MGALLNLIAGGVTAIWQQIQNGKKSGTVHNLWGYVSILADWVRAIVNDFSWVMGQENGAVTFSAQYAKQIGKDFETIEGYQQARWRRLTEVILPNTLSHAVGYVYSDGIVPLRQRMNAAEAKIVNLGGRMNVLEAWRTVYVDPWISRIYNWEVAVTKDYADGWNTVNDWLAHPGHFADWATAPLIGPTINYYADATHAESRDNLAKIMVAAWYEEPEAIWGLIQEWMLAQG